MIEQMAARCAVAVHQGERFLGSGFLVAPGKVLTCAHVAAKCSGDPAISVRWDGGRLPVHHIDLRPPTRDGSPIYPFPDLAVLTIDEPPEQPSVWLADAPPSTGSTVVCHGFSHHTPALAVARDSALLQVAGTSGQYVRVQQGEIPDGLSGSLVLDTATRRVCGLVKATRDAQSARGGWIIPATVIAEWFPEVAAANAEAHGPASRWRNEATRRAEFTQRLFGSRAPLQVPDPPPDAPPSWWLDPRHRMTRFQQRPEFDALLAWAVDEDPAAKTVKLVVGPGGSGKTRLAVELAARLDAAGWIAGVIVADDDTDRLVPIAHALPEVLAEGHRVFLVLDYVEGRPAELRRFLGRLPGRDEGTVRVLLLARFSRAWWRDARPSGDYRYRIDCEPIELPPLAAHPEDADEHFNQALCDYRSTIRGVEPARGGGLPPPGLKAAARRHSDALNLHALALVSVLHERDHGQLPDGAVDWDDPLSLLVAHDRKHWRSAATGLRSITVAELAAQTLLTPTLLPVYTADAATAAISRIPGMSEVENGYPGEPRAVAQRLQDLYPRQNMRWWSPLPLDRLGETLLSEVCDDAADDDSAVGYLTALLGEVDPAQAVPGLTVLARTHADTARPRTARCLHRLARDKEHRLLPALMLADRLVPPGRRTSVGMVAKLGLKDVLKMAEGLSSARGHRLREVGLELLDHADELLASNPPEAALPEEAQLLLTQLREQGHKIPIETPATAQVRYCRALLLMRMDRVPEAVEHAESAARCLRSFAGGSDGPEIRVDREMNGIAFVDGSSDYSDLLDRVLVIHAQGLRHLGRLEEAVRVWKESLSLTTGVPAMARGNEVAEILLDLDRPPAEALSYVPTPDTGTDTPTALSAAILTTRARALDRLGRDQQAQTVAAKALRLHQAAADETGDRRPLANAVLVLQHLTPLARTGDALKELQSSTSRDPFTEVPAFVQIAIRQARNLLDEGHVAEANANFNEALSKARQLADEDPDTYQILMARTLAMGSVHGVAADPVTAAANAAKILQKLAERREELRCELGMVYVQQALALLVTGRPQEDPDACSDALDVCSKAIHQLRIARETNPWEAIPALSTALGFYAECACGLERFDDAVKAVREAIDLETRRIDDRPSTPAEMLVNHRRRLIRALSGHVTTGSSDATAAIAEIAALARQIPIKSLTQEETFQAGAVLLVGANRLSQDNRHREALNSLDENVLWLRRYADAHPGTATTGLLLNAGTARARLLAELGEHTAAARATAELVTDCRRHAPDAHEARAEAMIWSAHVMGLLPSPDFDAEALKLATELCRTCRESPDISGERKLLGSAVLEIGQRLRSPYANHAGDDVKNAALELVTAVRVLRDEAPDLVKRAHADVFGFAASLLHDHDAQLAFSALGEAVTLHQNLPSPTSVPYAACLGVYGDVLSANDPATAIGHFERALNILIPAAQGSSQQAVDTLAGLLPLVANTYRQLGRDADIEELRAALERAGLVDVISAARHPQSTPPIVVPPDLLSATQAAERLALQDPVRGGTALRKVLETALKRGQFMTARSACHWLVDALRETGALDEAERHAELQVSYGRRAGAGPWTIIFDQARHLQIANHRPEQADRISAAASVLTAKMEKLADPPAGLEFVEPWETRELVWTAAATAALHREDWSKAVPLLEAVVRSRRDRGASPDEVALAEFNVHRPLIAIGEFGKAKALLDRCRAAFEESGQHDRLGLTLLAQGDLALVTEDLPRALELQTRGMTVLYKAGNVPYIHNAHTQLSRLHQQLDPCGPQGLVHILAAAMVGGFLGIPTDPTLIVAAILRRAGDYPRFPAPICSGVADIPGTRLELLLDLLSRGRPDAVQAMLDQALRRARDEFGAVLDEMARHRVMWDPLIAGIVAARRGDTAAGQVTRTQLARFHGNPDWSMLATALDHVLNGQAEQATMRLSAIDSALLRRCLETLDGARHIPDELAEAIPLCGTLPMMLEAAQTSQPNPGLSRLLAELDDHPQWQQLHDPIRQIIAGSRNPGLTAGLTTTHAAIVAMLLQHL